MRSRILGLITLAVATLAVALPEPVSAHPAGWYYADGKWPTGATIKYGLNAGFPSDTYWKARVYDAKQGWMAYAGSAEPKISWSLADGINHGTWNNPCSLAANNTAAVFYTDLGVVNSSWLAVTYWCNNGSTRVKATITVDTGRPWYTDTGDVPGGQFDLWSAVTHEWGHVLGSTHFAEGEAGVCPWDNANRHVMCPTTIAGYEVERYIKTHDSHTFQQAY